MSRRNTEHTRVRFPGVDMLVGAGALFLLCGLGVLALVATHREDGTILAVGGIVGGAFVVFGLLALLPGLKERASQRLVAHAPQGTCPEVPETPLLAKGSFTLAGETHRIEPESTPEHGALAPIPGLARRRTLFAVLFAAAFLTFVAFLLIVLDPPALRFEKLSATATRILFLALTAAALVPALAIVIVLMSRHLHSRPTLRWERSTWRLDGAHGELASGRRDELVAVQVVAARDVTGTRDRKTITDALEVNLVFGEGEKVERATLLRTNGAFDAALSKASCLAEHLDLPLLFHATARHWAEEKARARRRRARTEELFS